MRPELVTAIGDPASARVYVYDHSIPGKNDRYLEGRSPMVVARMPEGFSLDAASAFGMQMSLASETAGRWGLRQAYTIDYRSLHATSLARLGVTHVVSFHPLDVLRVEGRISGFFERPILLSPVPDPLPRTYVAGQARRAGTSRIVEERADRVVLEAELDRPGTLVLLDGYDPGWRARVDGREAPLLRANLAFRGIQVPAGRHRVEMVCRPRGLGFGLGVAALSLIALGLAGAPRFAAKGEQP